MVTQLFPSLQLITFLGVLVKKQTQLSIFQSQSYDYIKFSLALFTNFSLTRKSFFCVNFFLKIWNASRICVSSLRRGHANLLCIVPILVYVLLKRAPHFLLKKIFPWDFPGGPVVKTLHFHCRGLGFNPQRGN